MKSWYAAPRLEAQARALRDVATRSAWMLRLGAVLAGGLLGACPELPPPIIDPSADAGPAVECRNVRPDSIACEGDTAVQCNAFGRIDERTNCARQGLVCVPERGCLMCEPSRIRCDGERVLQCNLEGSAETEGELCDPSIGEHCSAHGCAPLCEEADAARSYLGCSYQAVPTSNSFLDSVFTFAVVVANAELVQAQVTITGGAGTRITRTIAPGTLEIFELPWIDALRRPVSLDEHLSVRSPVPAYRIDSDVPVTVHQFNPLRFREVRNCIDTPGSSGCFSFTNDASLLLPTRALTGSYLLISRAAQRMTREGRVSRSPGFVTVVGASDTPSQVTFRTTAYVARTLDNDMPRRLPGESFDFEVAPGEVVQFVTEVPDPCPVAEIPDAAGAGSITYCPLGADYDFTGSEIVTNGRVAVFAGHNCAFVPFDRWACDHLEEQIFPAESLGRSLLAQMSLQQRSEPHLVRIVSAADDNRIVFTPARDDLPELTLMRGESFEFSITRPVLLTGSAPMLAARFFVGQDFGGLGTAGAGALGDPSMGLLVPGEQWRREYVFLAPDTYTTTFLDLVAPSIARVELDGQVVGNFREASGTGLSVARIAISAGVHRVEASLPVGAHLYGFGSYTSYLVPAGLDLREIAEPL